MCQLAGVLGYVTPGDNALGHDHDFSKPTVPNQFGKRGESGTGNLGTSMISKSQEETEVSLHSKEKALEADAFFTVFFLRRANKHLASVPLKSGLA